MIIKALAVSAPCLCLAATALAEDIGPDTEAGRYLFSKVDEGFLRLDTRNGEVSVCNRHAVGWACQAVPEDRAVLENEIVRLRRENAALKKDILTHGLPLPAGSAPEPAAAADAGGTLPGADADLNRIADYLGKAWHRLVEAMARAEASLEQKLKRR